jgi:eukaryotic-like serine/threonine-protein kinase
MSVSGEQITPYLKLVRPLGEGGMGRLWVAEHQTLEIEVAVKLLNPTLAQDGHWLARFREEAHAIAKIDSVHVVRVFDYGTTPSNEPFIVMELLRGEDLLRRIERTNGLSLEEILQIVSQTCKALSRAHALGIVHRDLKPENIFLTREGEELFVKLLDFGIAKHQRPQRAGITEVDAIFGTPPYMSPEQILSAGSVDCRADLWALSVVIFEMLTGACPFAGPTPAAVCLKIQAGEFARPSEVRPGLPRAVDAWFKRAFHLDIRVRFTSADELLRELRQALQLPGATVTPSLSHAASLAPTLFNGPTPASAPAIEVGPLEKGPRRSTFLAAAAVIAVGLIAGFVVVTNARGGLVDSKKTQPLVASSQAAASSTSPVAPTLEPSADVAASPDSPPTHPDRGPAQPEGATPLTVRSEPRALPAQRAVKAKDAPPAPATNSPSPTATGQKPIKDRGF